MSQHNLPKPRAILFDWDNTLVDTWPTIHAALNEMMREMGEEEWPLEKVKSNVKRSMRDAFPEMFGDSWQDAAKIYQSAYKRIHLENLNPLVQAHEMLSLIREHEVPMGVVSNKRGDNLRKELDHLQWTQRFHVNVGAGDAARDKPHADPLLMALETLKLPADEQIWFVGDTVVDLECADAAGVSAILYGDIEPSDGIYEGAPYHHHVINHHAFIALLSNVLQSD